ncbi:hypothetical protein LguiA_028654 [Lonicera macranthoides]
MGCTQSKIENEEAVTRCKDRKQFMKEAVSARNAFAAAHSAYSMSLKNTGAALSDYAHGEVQFTSSTTSTSTHPPAILPAVTQPPYETLPPPPPPLPNFTSPPPPPLQRAASMPEFSIPKPDLKHSDPIIEEEDDEAEAEAENNENNYHSLRHRSTRSSGGGARIGVSNSEAVENEGLPKPPPSPRRRREATPPPPESKDLSSTYWDFFSEHNVPLSNLADVEDSRIEREEIERKAEMERKVEIERKAGMERKVEIERKLYEERSEIRSSEVDVGSRSRKGKAEVETDAVEMVDEIPTQPPPPVAAKAMKKVKNVVQVEGKRTGKVGAPVNLFQVFTGLDDAFLKASESAHEVSKMLEANRLHYHSNFADNRGHIDHSARVMRVITWNRSFKAGVLNPDEGKEDFDSEENETHATVLDKMLAWEKKLYDEVKAGELMKLEYQRKVASLTKLKKRGTNTEALERTKAAVSHLHTRYIVDMQSMDSTVSEINRLRDEQLYPKLVALVDGMATMWETMRMHHENQTKIIRALRSVDISLSSKETTKHHHERTIQLSDVVRDWHSIFGKLMTHQKEYIKALNNWLKLNLIPLDNNLKEKVSSPQRPQNPPIQTLLRAWQEYLEKLPEELARTAIYNFTAVIDTIVQYQVEEIKLMARCEDTRNELERKTRQFQDWKRKYLQKRTPPDEMDPDRAQDTDLVAERWFAVEVLQKRLEEEEEAYRRQCIQVRQKSLTTLRTRLPELFHAMSEFSLACADMYRNLRSISKQ